MIPYAYIYASVTSTSSIITLENHHVRMLQYPYDHVLYQPGQMCSTCRFLKPARSKHCSLCNVCITKHDHHCIWVMNCLGKGNYGYFIGMLLSLSIMLAYGAWLAYGILTQFLQESGLDPSEHRGASEHWATETTWSQYLEMWNWALAQDLRIGAVGLLALLTAPLGWGLFLYHIYLIWAGMTTNESSKWEDWKDAVQDGIVFRTERSPSQSGDKLVDSVTEPMLQWPAFSNQEVLQCEDGRPPDGHTAQQDDNSEDTTMGHSLKHEVRWKKVHSLREVENVYDLGFWDNLMDIFPSA